MAEITVSQQGAYIETDATSIKTTQVGTHLEVFNAYSPRVAQVGTHLEVFNAYSPRVAQVGAYLEVSTPLLDKYGPKLQVI